jgi:hypothetical protein
MLIPVIKRIKENNKCFIERIFPVEGTLSVSIGDRVEPFDHLGDCSFSQNELLLPKGFKPHGLRTEKRYYYAGSLLGKAGSTKVSAPYDGNLSLSENKKYTFKEIDKKYIVLSGVWGVIKSIYEKKSVLLETQTKDILFSASTEIQASGELVVFPNPTDILKRSYLENFAKGIKGKIVYIGHYVALDVVVRAYEMGASAVIAGSAHKEVFDYAKNNDFAFGIISGFGKIKTPDDVYKMLSSVSYRYVFFEGDKNLLRIPVPSADPVVTSVKEELTPIKHIDTGMNVQVFQNPYFGWVGVVDRVMESSIFVKFGIDKNSVEVRLPDFFIVE